MKGATRHISVTQKTLCLEWGWVSCFVEKERYENGGWEMSGTGKMVEESPAVNSLQSSLALGPKVPRQFPKLQKFAHKIT